MKTEYVSKTIIANKLLVELMNDDGKVAILATKQDLEDLIAACRGYKLGERFRNGRKTYGDIHPGDILRWEAHERRLVGLAADMEELLRKAFK